MPYAPLGVVVISVVLALIWTAPPWLVTIIPEPIVLIVEPVAIKVLLPTPVMFDVYPPLVWIQVFRVFVTLPPAKVDVTFPVSVPVQLTTAVFNPVHKA